MQVHPQIAAMIARRAAAGSPAYSAGTTEDARRLYAAAQETLPKGRGGEVHAVLDEMLDTPTGPVAIRRYRPFAAAPGATILYCHGGGWVIGTLDGFDPTCRALARATGAEVISVDYRLAPEHPFPAPLDDVYGALQAIAAEAPDRPLTIMGDSAGGNLAAACALRARRDGGPRIDLQVLLYPITDHDLDRPSYGACGDGRFLLSRTDMAWYWDRYVPAAADRLDPLASPLRAGDLIGLPPAIVVIAGCDPLADEGLAYAHALEADGVPVELRVFDDMIHGFFTLTGLVDPADAALRTIAEAISGRFRNLLRRS